MSKFSAQNASIVGSKMNGGGYFANIQKLRSVADEIMQIGRESIPYDTGNLMDSTGIGIYIDGVLIDFRYENQANVPQTFHGQVVWGKDKLDKALTLGASIYNTGVWIVLFSTVPYAIYQDRLSGFFTDVMKSNMKYLVLSQFKTKL